MISSYIEDFFGDPIRTGALQYDKNVESLLLENVTEIGNITYTRDNHEKNARRQLGGWPVWESCLIL